MTAVPAHNPDTAILHWEASYRRTHQPETVDFRSLVPDRVVPDRYTHLIHPYPAKLLPHIPYFFLRTKLCTSRGAETRVADPFCGSGTVLLEASLHGLASVGADANPLARLIARVKVTPLSKDILDNAITKIKADLPHTKVESIPRVVNITKWYSPRVIDELARIAQLIARVRNPDVRNFLRVCFSLCARKLSFADPRLSVPVRINLERKDKYGPHYRQLKEHVNAIENTNAMHLLISIAERNYSRVNSLPFSISPLDEIISDARMLHENDKNGGIDLIITSPPYLGAQKYIRSSSLSLGWLELAGEGELRPLERATIGREHFAKCELGTVHDSGIADADHLLEKVAETNPTRAHIGRVYLSEMESSIRSMHKALTNGGLLIMVTGPNMICGNHFDTPRFLEEIAHRNGFRTRFSLIDHIRSRGLMTKRNKTAAVIASEWVLCLEKCA